MKLELLCIEGCPNTAETSARVDAALSELGRDDMKLVVTVIGDSAQTGASFAGSPTITLDGTDLFPGAAPANDVSCRVYQTPNGLAGLPTVEQIRDGLQERLAR